MKKDCSRGRETIKRNAEKEQVTRDSSEDMNRTRKDSMNKKKRKEKEEAMSFISLSLSLILLLSFSSGDDVNNRQESEQLLVASSCLLHSSHRYAIEETEKGEERAIVWCKKKSESSFHV